VLIHEQHVLAGAVEFLARLDSAAIPYMVLTNNSRFTARDLSARLAASGLSVAPECMWTSALATARFLDSQRSEGTAYVLGEAGLTTALHEIGYVLTDAEPDYIVLGETRIYSFEKITKAIRLIGSGSRFIATNPDPTGPSMDGVLPATGSVAALITKATGVEPYYVGKPNPLMMRSALRKISAHSESTLMVGDRMDTDIVSGLEAGMRTVLVLSGISTATDAERFPYRPTWIVPSVAGISIGPPRRQEKGVSGRSRRSPST
jgi:NagD protein